LTHAGNADGWYHRYRFAGRGQQQKPGPGRALPELGQEAAEIPHMRLGGEQHGIELSFTHHTLRALGPGFVLGLRKPAFGLLRGHQLATSC
jgi:hypothetical protein